MNETNLLAPPPKDQVLWFRAGTYKVKKPVPPQKCGYIFDSDSTDASDAEECSKDEEGDTLLLYQIPQEDSYEPLLPAFIAQKISVPLESSTNFHSLMLDPPFATFNPNEEEKGSIFHRVSTSQDGFTSQMAVPNVDPRIMLTKEKKVPSSEDNEPGKKLDPIKKIPIQILGITSSFPIVTLIIPLSIIMIDFIVGLVLLFKSASPDDSLVSPFIFFFIGQFLPNVLVLYCLWQNSLWHSSAALQLSLWPLMLRVTLLRFIDGFLLIHAVLMMVLTVYILGDRKRIYVTKTKFYLERSIRDEEREAAMVKSNREKARKAKIK